MSIEIAVPFMALALAGAGIIWAHVSGKALDRKLEQSRQDHPAE
ncbi:hypothetical protein [Rhodophyticola sp. CCM32]|nr:hypothetical protein [Rhodophyticola sp. CCM32]